MSKFIPVFSHIYPCTSQLFAARFWGVLLSVCARRRPSRRHVVTRFCPLANKHNPRCCCCVARRPVAFAFFPLPSDIGRCRHCLLFFFFWVFSLSLSRLSAKAAVAKKNKWRLNLPSAAAPAPSAAHLPHPTAHVAPFVSPRRTKNTPKIFSRCRFAAVDRSSVSSFPFSFCRHLPV